LQIGRRKAAQKDVWLQTKSRGSVDEKPHTKMSGDRRKLQGG